MTTLRGKSPPANFSLKHHRSDSRFYCIFNYSPRKIKAIAHPTPENYAQLVINLMEKAPIIIPQEWFCNNCQMK